MGSIIFIALFNVLSDAFVNVQGNVNNIDI